MTVSAARHTFTPRGSAKDVWSCRAAEFCLVGPAGTGKSRTLLEKLHFMMLLNPGARGLIVRKTHTALTASALPTFDNHVLPVALGAGDVKYHGGSSREAASYRYANGSRILTTGMDNPDKVMSTDYDVIYVQEATDLSESDWEALTTRLRNGKISFQQLMADCNPREPTHWLRQRMDRGITKEFVARHEDNPTLFHLDGTKTELGKNYIAALDNLSGVRKDRFRYGKWVAAEGIIYNDYDSGIHLINKFDIPMDWPRYWSIDWGVTNPFVCQRWAEDPDGRLYLYAETYMTNRTVDEHAKAILSEVTNDRGSWTEPKPRKVIADHDLGDRKVFTKETGLPTTAAKKNVLHGIQAVQRRLRLAKDEKPRMYLCRDAVKERDQSLIDRSMPTSTVEEISGYVWNDKGKEEPVKSDDHGMDALRYLVVQRDLRPEVNVRWAKL